MRLTVRRGGERGTTRRPGVLSAHSLSFGAHYDPADTSFGALVAHNDEQVDPGAGFGPHAHRDVELVTWVVSGELLHEHDGQQQLLRAGSVQVLSTGDGVTHSEVNGGAGPLRFVQSWLLGAGPVAHARVEVPPRPGLTTVAAGPGRSAPLRLVLPGTALHVVRLGGTGVALPNAARLHAYVVHGEADVTGAPRLAGGDALRVEHAAGLSVTGEGELLVWELA